MRMETYRICPTKQIPEMQGLWSGKIWWDVPLLTLKCFRPEGSDHQPRTECKLLYNRLTLFGIFRVEDRHVRCVHTGFNTDVWKDSCVELFIQPAGSSGYFNFEFNCGGSLLASFVTNPARINGRLLAFTPLSPEDDRQIRRYTSLPAVVEPEIKIPCTWYLEFAIPITILEKYAGPIGDMNGRIWRANVYKCGNETSHPHWASWQPLTLRNFHQPESFGFIEFS